MKVAKAHLERYNATIALLEAERARLNEIVKKYRVILHPIRIIPPEIMRRIFSFCTNFVPPKSSLIPTGTPWVLGQVCHSWRSIATTMPHLWCSISLEIRSLKVVNSSFLVSQAWRLGLQLHRSHDAMLDVSLHAKRDIFSHPLMILICNHSHRWRHLRFGEHFSVLRSMSLIRGALPALESITVNSGINASSDQQIDCFDYCPRLRTVSLHGFLPLSTQLPWQQIKTFRFKRDPLPGDPTTSKFLEILRKLNIVEVCDIYFDLSLREGMSLTDESPALRFNLLTDLTISTHTRQDCTAAACFFKWLTAPKLSCLKILTPYFKWEYLISFISRSGCKLTELVIHEAGSLGSERDNTLIQVLTAVPDLVTLELGFVDGAADHHISIFSSPLVPRLEKLFINPQLPDSSSVYTDSILLDALEYRWNVGDSGVQQLRFVSLDRKVTDPLSCGRLDDLRSQGLSVVEWAN
ncbi:hypothetical protein Moror_12177 [Moniliophthora roreri MCA 2997]|uniref:Uncharacterized protein n=1 Tax=Moniliophthora roreri (strain MCA 2997) TaxID=1381753 RepID=V2WLB9_MONRO|nr:hypothetical protein Moror_12177 [Moniliophthora roreri MCA 2997]